VLTGAPTVAQTPALKAPLTVAQPAPQVSTTAVQTAVPMVALMAVPMVALMAVPMVALMVVPTVALMVVPTAALMVVPTAALSKKAAKFELYQH
jgi:hypothetical protein